DGKFMPTRPEEGYSNSSITNLMPDGSQVHIEPVKLGPISRIASYNGTLYFLKNGKLNTLNGSATTQDFIDWGSLPTKGLNDMVTLGNSLMIGTSRGLAELRGAAVKILKGEDGLPIEETTCLVKGFDDDLWIGTEKGAARMLKRGEFQYFSKGMWLPGKRVSKIAVG